MHKNQVADPQWEWSVSGRGTTVDCRSLRYNRLMSLVSNREAIAHVWLNWNTNTIRGMGPVRAIVIVMFDNPQLVGQFYIDLQSVFSSNYANVKHHMQRHFEELKFFRGDEWIQRVVCAQIADRLLEDRTIGEIFFESRD